MQNQISLKDTENAIIVRALDGEMTCLPGL